MVMAVLTAIFVPTFLVAKVPVLSLPSVTLSEPITPTSVAPLSAAVVVPL